MLAKRFGKEITAALDYKLRTDDRVIIIGQDICDPFGGCFKITKGLSTKYPERLINTPISEAGVMGVAIGLALQGYKPIVEFMFYDFILLAADQIYNHAVQFQKYWEPVNVTIRATIGKPDYGFQHTKDLDPIMQEMLPVYHPTPSDDVHSMLIHAIDRNEPTLFVEDSAYYPKRLEEK